jgi:hypothetical protein
MKMHKEYWKLWRQRARLLKKADAARAQAQAITFELFALNGKSARLRLKALPDTKEAA